MKITRTSSTLGIVGPRSRSQQNRTEQNRTEQNRTEQNRTEQNLFRMNIHKITSRVVHICKIQIKHSPFTKITINIFK